MNQKDPVEQLLAVWQAPEVRADFEAAVLRQLRCRPLRESVWQRWFTDPWELAGSVWRQRALVTAGGAALALVLVVIIWRNPGLAHRETEVEALSLDPFSSFPKGSITAVYSELVQR
jgi:hypothetical protein